MMMDSAIHNLYKVVTESNQPVYLFCGRPEKIKNLSENIGKVIDISGKRCIIAYPLQYLVNKGESYIGGFLYSIGVAKNVMVQQKMWEYKDGRLTSCNGGNSSTSD